MTTRHMARTVLLAVLILPICGVPGQAHAQMAPNAVRAGGESVDQAKAQSKTNPDGSASGWYDRYLGRDSRYRGLIFSGMTLLILLGLYRSFTRRVRRYVKEHAFKEENARRFLRTWKGAWTFGILVFMLIAFSGSLSALGISAGFLGMILGWSLQAPVTGLAAWLMIVVKKPFNVGDRVIIAGTIGDVTDITLTHIVLNQVGGTVAGEEQSGRGVLIPNGLLFSHVITNYTLEQNYILDEVPVRVSFDSDVDLARELLLGAVQKAAGEVIKETGQKPFLRMEFYDAGVLIRLRYHTIPAERQRISSQVVEDILRTFKAHYPQVKFGYPHSVVRYQRDTPPAVSPAGDRQ